MNLDTYVKNLKMVQDSDGYLSLLMVLPAISMLKKLMRRKNNGKKKFSEAFSFEEKWNQIVEAEQSFASQLEKKNIEKEKDILLLENLASLSTLASNEISNVSLKGDYIWIGSTFGYAKDLLKDTK